MQSLKSNYDYNGSFGKVTEYAKPTTKLSRGFKKITSVQQFNKSKHQNHQNGSVKKSSSSNSFTENDSEYFEPHKPHSYLHIGNSNLADLYLTTNTLKNPLETLALISAPPIPSHLLLLLCLDILKKAAWWNLKAKERSLLKSISETNIKLRYTFSSIPSFFWTIISFFRMFLILL